MDIPLIIGGREAGTLRTDRDGLYTVLEAALPGGTEQLVRLWVHGGGKSACLGVMEPRGDTLVLRRRLSRRELAALPSPIDYVSDSEEVPAPDSGTGESEGLHNSNVESEPISVEAEADSLHNAVTDMHACPWPAEVPEEGLCWYARPDGTLTAFDGVSGLLALPAGLRAPCPHAIERVIEGQKYLVFRY